jgi:hypothetical protein
MSGVPHSIPVENPLNQFCGGSRDELPRLHDREAGSLVYGHRRLGIWFDGCHGMKILWANSKDG